MGLRKAVEKLTARKISAAIACKANPPLQSKIALVTYRYPLLMYTIYVVYAYLQYDLLFLVRNDSRLICGSVALQSAYYSDANNYVEYNDSNFE